MVDTVESMLSSVARYLSRYVKTVPDQRSAERILEAMTFVNRKFYCPHRPYSDNAQAIGFDQTISQPSTVAAMLLISELQQEMKVLELGSGSGWNASLIGYLCSSGTVLSTEVIPELTNLSIKNLDALNTSLKEAEQLTNIEFKCLNIFKELDSWEDRYDRIIVTAGMFEQDSKIVDELGLKLLEEGGMLICPRSVGPIQIIRKQNGKLIHHETGDSFGFVPLIT
jgi:protein-L-isoaspartate(D-aspartate) O-methyltransferase